MGAGRTRTRERGDRGRSRRRADRPQDAKARRSPDPTAPVRAAQAIAAEDRTHRAKDRSVVDGETRARRVAGDLRGLHRGEQGAADRYASPARRPGLGTRARRSRVARAARSARARSRLKALRAAVRYAFTGAGVSAPGVGAFHGATRNNSAMPG